MRQAPDCCLFSLAASASLHLVLVAKWAAAVVLLIQVSKRWMSWACQWPADWEAEACHRYVLLAEA